MLCTVVNELLGSTQVYDAPIGTTLGTLISADALIGDSYVLCNGRLASPETPVVEGGVYRMVPRLVGGKGGFGSMLRAIGAQIEKTTNREACRDLSGRRMRDVNNEKKLKEWVGKAADREREKLERKRERLERRKAVPKHMFHDPEYHEQKEKVLENLDDAMKAGLQKSSTATSTTTKRKAAASSTSTATKKSKAEWLGVDIDMDDLSDSDEDSTSGDDEAQPSHSGASADRVTQENGAGGSGTSSSTSDSSTTGGDSSATTSRNSAPDSSSATSRNNAPDSSSATSRNNAPDSSATSRNNAPDSSSATSRNSAPDSSSTTSRNSAPDSSSATSRNSAPDSSTSSSDDSSDCAQKNDTEETLNEKKTEEPTETNAENKQKEEAAKTDPDNKNGLLATLAQSPPKQNIEQTVQEVDLDACPSAESLEAVGLDSLKMALMSRGLKCGGTLQERAARLFSVKGLSPSQIDPALKSKGGGKGGKKSKRN